MAHEQCGENGETICDSGEKLPFLAWSVVSFFLGGGVFCFVPLEQQWSRWVKLAYTRNLLPWFMFQLDRINNLCSKHFSGKLVWICKLIVSFTLYHLRYKWPVGRYLATVKRTVLSGYFIGASGWGNLERQSKQGGQCQDSKRLI